MIPSRPLAEIPIHHFCAPPRLVSLPSNSPLSFGTHAHSSPEPTSCAHLAWSCFLFEAFLRCTATRVTS